jgi:hypothetical protein
MYCPDTILLHNSCCKEYKSKFVKVNNFMLAFANSKQNIAITLQVAVIIIVTVKMFSFQG